MNNNLFTKIFIFIWLFSFLFILITLISLGAFKEDILMLKILKIKF